MKSPETAFTGAIPTSFGNLGSLRELDLSFNELSGEVPPSLGQCAELRVLHLQGNELSGGVPGALQDLPELTSVNLKGNELVGEVPSGMCAAGRDVQIQVDCSVGCTGICCTDYAC